MNISDCNHVRLSSEHLVVTAIHQKLKQGASCGQKDDFLLVVNGGWASVNTVVWLKLYFKICLEKKFLCVVNDLFCSSAYQN